ncbi:helix-turn-helix transcriptional regulator [Clostridium sp.]|uniref:helix-turn-helix domain-containing protein n=1 Tax=Clostridium sp. TaxID=1506 RepID=UPI0025BB76F3|nr:helix-turn-helix transcriptional regulator [Clostridium sp.]
MEVRFDERVNLGGKLRINRKRKNYSMNELAKKSGISFNTIAGIETGRTKKMKLEEIIRMSETLGVTLEELIVEGRKISV